MRIAFIFTHFLPNIGGTEISMYYYARELVKKGHKVIVITTNAIGYRPVKLPPTEVMDGIEVRRLRYWPIPFYKQFMLAPSLLKILLSINIDAAIIFSLLPSFFIIASYLMLRMRNIPIIAHPQAHPYRSKYKGTFIALLDRIFIKTIGALLLKKADWVIALSQEERDFYLNECGVRRVTILYEGVNHLPNDVTENDIQVFMRKYNLMPGNYIVVVGRIEERKGLDVLIRAIAGVVKEVPDARLLIIGADPERLWPTYRRLCKVLGCDKHVYYLGRVPDRELVCVYKLAKIVAIPSHFEAYSRVAFEALYYGKPVVATRGIATHDVIKSYGIVTLSNNHVELAKALIKLLKDRDFRETLSKRARAFAEGLTWCSRARSLESVLLRIVNNRKRLRLCE